MYLMGSGKYDRAQPRHEIIGMGCTFVMLIDLCSNFRLSLRQSQSPLLTQPHTVRRTAYFGRVEVRHLYRVRPEPQDLERRQANGETSCKNKQQLTRCRSTIRGMLPFQRRISIPPLFSIPPQYAFSKVQILELFVLYQEEGFAWRRSFRYRQRQSSSWSLEVWILYAFRSARHAVRCVRLGRSGTSLKLQSSSGGLEPSFVGKTPGAHAASRLNSTVHVQYTATWST